MMRVGTYVRKALSTSVVLALMRLLSGVRSNMNGQSTSLNEALTASLLIALIRSFVGVYPVMSLQVRLAVEALYPLPYITG